MYAICVRVYSAAYTATELATFETVRQSAEMFAVPAVSSSSISPFPPNSLVAQTHNLNYRYILCQRPSHMTDTGKTNAHCAEQCVCVGRPCVRADSPTVSQVPRTCVCMYVCDRAQRDEERDAVSGESIRDVVGRLVVGRLWGAREKARQNRTAAVPNDQCPTMPNNAPTIPQQCPIIPRSADEYFVGTGSGDCGEWGRCGRGGGSGSRARCVLRDA